MSISKQEWKLRENDNYELFIEEPFHEECNIAYSLEANSLESNHLVLSLDKARKDVLGQNYNTLIQ